MPLEISEIMIRMSVSDRSPREDGDTAGSGCPGDCGGGQAALEPLVEECVTRVLRAIRAAQER